MPELTAVVKFTLKDMGVPSLTEIYPKYAFIWGEYWLALAMPGPGHDWLGSKSSPIYLAGGKTIGATYGQPGILELGEHHLVVAHSADGIANLYLDGNVVASGQMPLPTSIIPGTPIGGTLRTVQMAKPPQISVSDLRVYDRAFGPAHVQADMTEPVPGWVWRQGYTPWGLYLVLGVLILVVSSQQRQRQ